MTSFVYRSTPLNDLTLCAWKYITDLNCAGCGLTRSFCAISSGDLILSFQDHPAGPFLYAAMVWFVCAHATRTVTNRPSAWTIPTRILNGYWITVGIVLAANLVDTVTGWF